MFEYSSIIIAIFAVIVLFIFSLQKFSKEIQQIGSGSFKSVIKRATSTPIKGVFVGGIFTSIVQSSSATTVITVGLVNAGLLSFYNSLGVVFGANIGTTVTSQLIALNLTAFAPIFIILGFLIEVFVKKYKLLGKAIFYFGLIFFSLSLLSMYITPLASNPEVINIFSRISNVFIGILLGFVFTAIVQSSSVTSGIVVVISAQGLIGFLPALGIILGANIGTTVTSLLASINSSPAAKKTALSHLLFNVIGVLLILPVIVPFSHLIAHIGGSPQQQIANAHVIFNVSCTVLFLVFIKLFYRLVDSFKFSKRYNHEK